MDYDHTCLWLPQLCYGYHRQIVLIQNLVHYLLQDWLVSHNHAYLQMILSNNHQQSLCLS